jgi:predicted nucleotidyltransferase
MPEMSRLGDLADQYQVELILIFGSQAREDVHPDSDLDIAVYGRQVFSEKEKIQLTYELCNFLHTNDVDLVDLKTASPSLKKEVFKNYKILLQRDPMLLYHLELANIHEMKELEILGQIRRERLKEFVR